MATLTSSLIVRLIDNVTKPARSMASSLLGLQKAGGKGFGERLNNAIERNNRALDQSRGRLVDAVAGFYALKTAIASPVQAAMQFESAMADVRKVVDFKSENGLEEFKRLLLELSREVPQSVNGLAQIAAAAGQAGIAGEELVKFTEAAAKIGVAFDISADETGTALAKMMTGLGLTIDQVVLLSDSMNHLSNSQASSAAEILDVVRRVGAQAKLFGFTAEQTAAFASAMIAAGSQSDVAATSFRNMGLALTRGESATKRQKKALKELGLDATSVAKRMQEDAVGTTIDVLEKLAQLPKELQATIASDLFGNEARALGPLLTNLQLVKDSLGLVSDESKYAGSAFKEFEVRAKTFENAVAIFNNILTKLKITIGAALIPALTDLMQSVIPLIDTVSDFAAAHPELTKNVIAATAAVIGFKIAVAGLKFVGLLGRGGALSMMALGFNTVGKAAIGAVNGVRGMVAYQAALAAMAGKNYGGLRVAADALKGMALAAPGIGALSTGLTAVGGALAAITAPAWAAIAAGVALVAAAGYALYRYWDRVSSVIGGVARRLGEEFKPAIDLIRPTLEYLSPMVQAIGDGFSYASEKLGEFIDWLGTFFEKEALTEDQKAAWGRVGYDLADSMIQSIKDVMLTLLDWFANYPYKIREAIGSIDLGSLISMPSLSDMFSGGGSETDPSYRGRGSKSDAIEGQSGHRAGGGPVWSGGNYLVGDGGEPEVFSPRKSGDITPLSQIQQSIESGFARFASAAGSLSGTPQQVVLEVTEGAIVINGATDPVTTAQLMMQMLSDQVDRLLRASNADMGARP